MRLVKLVPASTLSLPELPLCSTLGTTATPPQSVPCAPSQARVPAGQFAW
jgi:hypothetical protein